MKRYTVTYAITGTAWVEVEASSAEEARKIAKSLDVPDPRPGSIEWEYDEVLSVEEA